MGTPDTDLAEIPSMPAENFMESFRTMLEQYLEQLAAHRAMLDQAVQATAQAEARIRRTLRAAFPDEPAPKPQRSGAEKKSFSPPSIGAERLASIRDFVIDWFRENPDGSIRQVDLCAGIGCSSTVASTGFAVLRNENLLRLSGQSGSYKFFKLTKSAEEEYGIGKSSAPGVS